jgi:hypothetical protein
MKIENKSARVVHFSVPGGPVTVPPLGSVELSGEQASAAKAILDGPWKPLVDDGSLVVDGKPAMLTPPTAGEPPTVPTPLVPTSPTSGGFGSDVSDKHDHDPIPSKPPSRR